MELSIRSHDPSEALTRSGSGEAATRVGLVPLTPEARAALDGADRLTVSRFPFRLGRRPRAGDPDGEAPPEVNDCGLIDRGRRLWISRAHLVIHQRADGSLEVEDRGSTCGTTVGTTFLHASRDRHRCVIRDGERLVVGDAKSPYAFRLDFIDPPA